MHFPIAMLLQQIIEKLMGLIGASRGTQLAKDSLFQKWILKVLKGKYYIRGLFPIVNI